MPTRRPPAQELDAPQPKAHGTAADLFSPGASLATLRARAAGCTACPLYKNATQTVFGEGPASAPLMLVGETPGDREDI